VKKFKYCFIIFIKQKIHTKQIFNKAKIFKNIFNLLNHFALLSYFQFSRVYILLYFTSFNFENFILKQMLFLHLLLNIFIIY